MDYKNVILILLIFSLGCSQEIYQFDLFNNQNEFSKKALDEIINTSPGNNYSIQEHYQNKLCQCEVAYKGIVEYDLTTLNNCKGLITGYHLIEIIILKDKNLPGNKVLMSSKRLNKVGDIIGPALYFIGLNAEFNADSSFNFSTKFKVYKKRTKFKSKKSKVDFSLFYNVKGSDIFLSEIFYRDYNKVSSDKGLAFDFNNIFGWTVKLSKK